MQFQKKSPYSYVKFKNKIKLKKNHKMIFKNPLLIYILAFIPLILPFIKSVVREQFTC